MRPSPARSWSSAPATGETHPTPANPEAATRATRPASCGVSCAASPRSSHGTRRPPTLWLRLRSCCGAQLLRKPKSFSQPADVANDTARVPASAPRHTRRTQWPLSAARCIPTLSLPIYGSSGCANPLSSPAHGLFLQCAGCRPRFDACPQARSAKHSPWSIKQRAGGVSLHLPTTSL